MSTSLGIGEHFLHEPYIVRS